MVNVRFAWFAIELKNFISTQIKSACLDFLREVVEVASDQSSADLYHWSAMEFGEHWLQRLSLVLARGQADLVLEAVKTARKNHRGRDGGRGASAEWSQTDCQPCVSLV